MIIIFFFNWQLADPPIAPYNDQAEMYVPLDQVPRSNFSRSGQMQVHVIKRLQLHMECRRHNYHCVLSYDVHVNHNHAYGTS